MKERGNLMNFAELKEKAIEKYFSGMNPQQLEAIKTVKGAVLVLAGAGSGKTTVIVNRIANMILFGDVLNTRTAEPEPENLTQLEEYIQGKRILTAEELQKILNVRAISPWKILAITFTNKAAGELKERLSGKLGEAAQKIHASTFHSACVRMLRTCIDRIGYQNNFTIYDTDDSVQTMKQSIKDCQVSEKDFPVKQVLSAVSRAKDEMISPEEYTNQYGSDYRQKVTAKLYQNYQEKLKSANAVDFDDLIYLMVRIFEQCPDILEKYQNKYMYILVDEYQDTNHAQYRLISLLSAKYGNLCVVGDDDQSIYRFRGADIQNILSFEDEFADCKTIRLEKNYRSTQHILSAANSVIRNNISRKTKTLWTSAGDGEKVHAVKLSDEQAESQYIAEIIQKAVASGKNYSDFMVLYRMNALSNMVEKTLIRNKIPYRIYGGIRFQDRKEIRDVMAYLSILSNPEDLIRFRRVVNTPKRGIGEVMISRITDIAQDLHISPIEVMRNSVSYPILGKRTAALTKFVSLMDELQQALKTMPLAEFFDFMLEKTGYTEMLEQEKETGKERLENVKEFRSNIVYYVENAENPDLEGFLAEMALYTDADKENSADTVSLMTIHSAKGLESDSVFAVGMENNLFPSYRSMENEEDLEEERRLAYVLMTRAKRHLFLLHTEQRLIFGDYRNNELSQFVKEIEQEHLETEDKTISSKRKTSTFSRKIPESNLQKQMELLSQTKNTPVQGSPAMHFSAGEEIQDSKFGNGIILRAEKMGNDYLLEIAFDNFGTKKLMARYRKITKR